MAVLAGLIVLVIAGGIFLAESPSSSTAPPPQSSTSMASSISVVIPPTVGPYDEEGVPMLINKWNMLPEGYSPPLADAGNGQQLHTSAVEPFKAMQAAAKEDGITLTPISGYRTHQRQTNNYNSSIQRYLNQGYSQEEAEELTQRYYAIPGASEHEAGLAMDINSLETSFDQTKEFQWLQENCFKFGFILRYAEDTTDITGIYYEPWHYRYVGTNHAKLITEMGITLEEYVELLSSQQG